jgi:uncharacterized membrane protein YedE/YeeE
MREFLSQPWPWYVAGPLIGLIVPALLIIGNKPFGISANLRHACAIVLPGDTPFFRYDWRGAGGWNLAFVAGIAVGGFIASTWLASHAPIGISIATKHDLATLGVRDFSGLVPVELFSWRSVLTVRGFVMMIVGGGLVGFGTAYAGGCTSGHAISGLANLQLPSLIAVLGFFAGGLIATWLLLPLLLGRTA